ncbi:DinB family protein [Glycomyces sp. YM15]|uniref:DinB family protein n=1 Tax=Glycomyces sp. YM15 TaxID=2800446 RepID=UPI001962CC29|nr:DinB family protein [Glycomyces sp. YM15]
MTVRWPEAILGQLDFYWDAHLRPRLEGLTDDEYFWEPVDGCWSLRPDAEGALRMDGADPAPEPPPVTTIAWRMLHIGRDVLGVRTRAFFGPNEGLEDAEMWDLRLWPDTLPATAADALAMLEQSYAHWREGVRSLDAEAIEEPLGPQGGWFAESPMAALVLHLNREVMAHGAEICLLRDLYRAKGFDERR